MHPLHSRRRASSAAPTPIPFPQMVLEHSPPDVWVGYLDSDGVLVVLHSPTTSIRLYVLAHRAECDVRVEVDELCARAKSNAPCAIVFEALNYNDDQVLHASSHNVHLIQGPEKNDWPALATLAY